MNDQKVNIYIYRNKDYKDIWRYRKQDYKFGFKRVERGNVKSEKEKRNEYRFESMQIEDEFDGGTFLVSVHPDCRDWLEEFDWVLEILGGIFNKPTKEMFDLVCPERVADFEVGIWTETVEITGEYKKLNVKYRGVPFLIFDDYGLYRVFGRQEFRRILNRKHHTYMDVSMDSARTLMFFPKGLTLRRFIAAMKKHQHMQSVEAEIHLEMNKAAKEYLDRSKPWESIPKG